MVNAFDHPEDRIEWAALNSLDPEGEYKYASKDKMTLESSLLASVNIDEDGDIDMISFEEASGYDRMNLEDLIEPPVLEVNSTLEAFEGLETPITSADLFASDPDTPPEGLIYEIQALPIIGEITLQGVALSTGQVFTQQEIDDGSIAFRSTGEVGTDELLLSLTDGTNLISGIEFSININTLIPTATIDAYSPKGSVVAAVTGGSAPYSIDYSSPFSSLFSIANGDQIIVNDDLWRYGEITVAIPILDADLQSVGTEIIEVTGFPTNTNPNPIFIADGSDLQNQDTNDGEAFDVDNDGDIDIVTISNTAINVYLNDGSGQFTLNSISAGNSQTALDYGDADNDGDIDLLISGNFSLGGPPFSPLFLNDGAGNFTIENNVGDLYNQTLANATFGDFDQDGDLDIIASSETGNALVILRNDGAALFATVPEGYFGSVPTSADYILSVSDMDVDGDIDVFLSRSPEGTYFNIYEGNSSLTPPDFVFTGSNYLGYGQNGNAVTFDADGDNDLDIITATTSFYGFRENNRGGSFSVLANPFVENYLTPYEVGDIDADGDIDIIVGSSLGSTDTRIYLNEGSAVFSSYLSLPYLGSAPYYGFEKILARDFDGDGDLDLVGFNNDEGTFDEGQNFIFFQQTNNLITSLTLDNLVVSRKDPKGTIVGTLSTDDPEGLPLRYELVSGPSGEGADNASFSIRQQGTTANLFVNNDLSKLNRQTLDLYVRVSDDFGDSFETAIQLQVQDLPASAVNSSFFRRDLIDPAALAQDSIASNVKIVDFDFDGDADIVVSNAGLVNVFYNDGDFSDGFLFDGTQRVIANLSPATIRKFDLADIDFDGDLDVVTAKNLASYPQTIFINEGTGYTQTGSSNLQPTDLQFLDADRDGDFDVVSLSFNDGYVYENDGTYNFDPNISQILFPENLVDKDNLIYSDFDRDGDLDFLYLQNGNELLVRQNTPLVNASYPFGFPSVTTVQTVFNINDFDVADFNNDGFADIITEDSVMLFNDITQQFENFGDNITDRSGLDFINKIEVGDIDGNGDLDLVLGNGFGDYELFFGDGSGFFAALSGAYLNPPLSSNVTDLAFEDLDGDGDMDVVFVTDGTGTDGFQVFFNNRNFNLNAISTQVVNRGLSTVISNESLLVTDADTPPELLTFTVNNPLPVNGQIVIEGTPVSVAGATFTQAQVNSGQVAYLHDNSATAGDTLFFAISDGFTALTSELPFEIVAVPILVNNTLIPIDEGSIALLSSSRLSVTDPNDAAADLVFTVQSTPSSLQLELQSNPNVAISTFTQADIDNGEIIIRHDGSEVAGTQEIVLEVSDPASNSLQVTVTIDVTAINDAPESTILSDLTVSFGADSVLSNSNLELLDADNLASDVVVNILSTPAVGQVELASNPGVAVSSFTKEDLDNGNVIFSHLGASNAATDSIEFEVTDGVEVLPVQTLNILVNNVAPPTLVNNTGLTLGQGETAAITDTELLADDADTPIGELIYTVTSAPTAGQLEDPAAPGVAISSFTQTDLISGNVVYVHDNSLVLTDQFGFTVSDNATTLPETTFTIDVIKDQLRSDSTMLVNIYETTNGVEWTNQAGWLTDPVNTWDGVTVTGAAVTGLDLSSNGLEGQMDISGDGLDSLQTLDVSGNKLSELLGAEEKVDLTTVNVRFNSMDFDAVAALLAGSYTLTYDSMNALLPVVDTLVQIGDDVLVDRTVGGGDSYTWFKDGEAISQTGSSFTLAGVDFPEDGEYHAEVTNTAAPGLTITTNPFFLKVSSRERDSTSLLIVYRELGLIGETEEPPYPYQGVTLANNRAQSIDISGLGASDTLSEAIRDVESLESLDISNNEITVLPDLTGSLPNLIEFKISENLIQFTDIEKNFNFNENEQVIDYLGGMKSFDLGADSVTFQQGTPFDLSFTFEGNNVSYAWEFVPYRETEAQSVGQESTYAVDSIKRSDMGTYRLLATDSGVPGLELQTDSTLVLAFAQLTGTVETPSGSGLPSGLMDVFEIDPTSETGYPLKDSLVAVTDGTFTVPNLILGDYICLTFDPSDEFLPTYFGNTIDWDEADDTGIIVINQDTEVSNYVMLSALGDIPANEENGELDMLVETNFDEDGEQDSRIERRRRARRAACFLSRRTRAGGGRLDQSGEFELIAFQETDDNGNVSFGNLPEGEYRINIQFPGIPMEDSEQVEFVIEPGEEGSQFSANAEITEDGISVEVEKILGIIRKYFRDLSIYPNPANENFTLKYGRLLAENVRMRMISLSGTTLKDIEIADGYDQEITVTTTDVEEGVYVLYFYDEKTKENVLSYKIIVTNR